MKVENNSSQSSWTIAESEEAKTLLKSKEVKHTEYEVVASEEPLQQVAEEVLVSEQSFDSNLLKKYSDFTELNNRGNFGTVFSAVALAPPYEEVVIKEIQTNSTELENSRVTREVELLAKCSKNCPFIIDFVDYLREPMFSYVVTKYEKGGELIPALIKNPQLFTESRTAKALSHICSALEHLESKSIAHREY